MSYKDKAFGYEKSLLCPFKVNFWIRIEKTLVCFSFAALEGLWILANREEER